MKNKWYEVLGAGLLSVSAMYFCTALVTGCSGDNGSVTGGDAEELSEVVESGDNEEIEVSSSSEKDKKAKSSSSEKSEKIESSSSEKAESSDSEKAVSSSSEDSKEYAVENKALSGVAQKGPFIDGSVWVGEVDCETLRRTSGDEKFWNARIDMENGVYNVENLNMASSCAKIKVEGYYLDEHTGAKSKKEVLLHAFVNLENRSTVNINVFTQLEYDRIMYLVEEKKMPVAEAKALAKKEILALFDIKDDIGDFADLDILKPGDGNAALLAASVLLTAQTESEKNAHLTYSVDSLRKSYTKTGEWDAEMKTKIANWAHSAKENGQLETIRKNIAGWEYTESVPEFEKYVEAYAEAFYDPEKDESSSKTPGHTKEWQDLHDLIYHYVLEEKTPETLYKECCQGVYRDDKETNADEYLMDEDAFKAEYGVDDLYKGRSVLIHDTRIWDGDEWDDPRYPNVHYEIWLDTICVGEAYEFDSDKISAVAGYMIRYTIGVAPDVEERTAYVEVYVKLNSLDKPYIPAKKEDD